MNMPPDTSHDIINIVVMAKPAIPGKVKTRLISDLNAQQATYVHQAMLDCILQRAPRQIPLTGVIVAIVHCILALDTQDADLDDYQELSQKALSGCCTDDISHNEYTWHKIDQGSGDLGERMTRVWQKLEAGACGGICGGTPGGTSGGATVFLGADCPDVPDALLASILPGLQHAQAAVGPVDDGGYWTLAAQNLPGPLLTDIRWGSSQVLDQTAQAARRADIELTQLQAWFDVDTHDDLMSLRDRLARHASGPTADLHLKRLGRQIHCVL